jgi:histidinol-phosphate aminotransferase
MEAGPPTGREAIRQLVPYELRRPAAAARRELGIDHVVNLALNEGAHPPFPAALEAISRSAGTLNRYPERTDDLRELVAARHGVPVGRIALGNGADGLLNYISLAYLDAGDEAAFCWPSFGSYWMSTIKAGGRPVTAPLHGGSYDLDALAERIGPRTRIVHVCNPNNPTGGIVERDALRRFLDAVPERVLVVVDQAYHEYVTDPAYADAAAEHGDRANVCVLRTFSKMYGLAGLRIGYAVAAPEVCAEIGRVRNAFDVNALALVAAAASIGEHEEIARRQADMLAERARLAEGLERLGLIPLASHGNFVCVPVPDGQALAGRLEEEGVIVRPLGAFGAPDAVRVTVGTPQENEIFLQALGRVLTPA